MREIEFRAWVIAERRMIYQPALLECGILEYDWASVCIGYKPGTDPDDYERKTIPCLHTLAKIGYGLVELMQYTGLKDKQGRKIYKGDIVFNTGWVRDDSMILGHNWLVEIGEYSNADLEYGSSGHIGFYAQSLIDGDETEGLNNLPGRNIEIIGNKYENPELMPSPERGNP